MKEGFFFNWINMLGDQLSIYQGVEHPVPVFTDVADASLSIPDQAAMAAEIAFY